jgi:hypothetical protein
MRHRMYEAAAGLLALVFLIALEAAPAIAEEGDPDAELAKIWERIDELKAAYEVRIEALEQKVAEQAALKAQIDEKEKQIRDLTEKVADLERKEDDESLAARVEELEQAEAPRHKAAPVGAYGGLMNPDVSVIGNFKGFLSSDENNPLDKKFLVQEAEVGLQGYLWPGIRGDVFAALEQHVHEDGDIETEIDLEEAYVSFLDLPLGFQVQAGRKLQDFGRVNPIHPHHWAFPDTPLPLRELFGDHPWFDDGVQVSTLVPNPLEAYFKIEGGVWNGRKLGHHHEDEEEDHEEMVGFEGPVDWGGHVFTARAAFDFSLGDQTNLMPGYSFAGGEFGDSIVHDVDLTLIHRWPRTYRRLRWQNELIFGDFEYSGQEIGGVPVTKRHVDAWGGYSLLLLTLDKYWETGTRFDWWNSEDVDDEWGMTAFLTYYFSHSMYLRPAYRYSEYPGGADEHLGLVQLVWGLGPHSHRLED